MARDLRDAADTFKFYINKAFHAADDDLTPDQYAELMEAVEYFERFEERVRKLETVVAYLDRGLSHADYSRDI